MINLLFSITVSVSLTAVFILLFRNRLAEKYGFKLIYVLSLILAIRMVIPYSIQFPNAVRFTVKIPRITVYLWAVGAIISALYHIIGFLWFERKLKRNGRTVKNCKCRGIFERIRKEMFIEKDIELLSLKDISSPMLAGFFRPVIVLPEESYSTQEYEMIFRHELTHFERKDNFKKLFFMIAASVQWFNPLSYILMNEAFQSLECICDEKVTAKESPDFKRGYCLMLLSTGRRGNSGQPIISYFSTKKRLTARINNIFGQRTAKNGSVLIISAAISATLLSGMLCSCTVETPQDVIDEMNRIESGVANEKNAETAPQNNDKDEIKLLPVSEVTENAGAELAALMNTNGIFKLDNARVYIPQKDAITPFTVRNSASVNDISDIYEQYYWLEEEFFGEHYPLEKTTAVYNIEKDGEFVREEVSLAEAMNRSDLPFALLQMDDTYLGQIEWLPWEGRCWFTKELWELKKNAPVRDYGGFTSTIYEMASFNIDEEVYASNADDETMNKKHKLYRGEISLKEAGEWCENYLKTVPYIYDKNVSFKAEHFELRGDDDLCTVFVWLMTYLDGVPYPAENAFLMIQPDKAEQVFFPAWDMNFIPREDGKITEIVPLSAVFDIIKESLSNSIVYDVDEIMLGYGYFEPLNNVNWFEDLPVPLMPVWTVELHTVNKEITVTVDAVTGECRTDIYNR